MSKTQKKKTDDTARWVSYWERRGEAERLIRFITGRPHHFNIIKPSDMPAIVDAFLIFNDQYDDSGYRDPWWPKRSEVAEWLAIIASPETNRHWYHLTDHQKSRLTITIAIS